MQLKLIAIYFPYIIMYIPCTMHVSINRQNSILFNTICIVVYNGIVVVSTFNLSDVPILLFLFEFKIV